MLACRRRWRRSLARSMRCSDRLRWRDAFLLSVSRMRPRSCRPSHSPRRRLELMSRNQNTPYELVLVAAILLLSLRIGCNAIAGGADEQVCDVGADYSLGVEDYTKAIRLHREVVRRFPENALAHYHLGFALGMMGNETAEIREYQRAKALGLRNWDLFLNLGLAQLENGDLDPATDSLQSAVLLGEAHPASHFNLALVSERRGLLADSEYDAAVSRGLN